MNWTLLIIIGVGVLIGVFIYTLIRDIWKTLDNIKDMEDK